MLPFAVVLAYLTTVFLNTLSVVATLSCVLEIETPFTAKLYMLITFYTTDDSLVFMTHQLINV